MRCRTLTWGTGAEPRRASANFKHRLHVSISRLDAMMLSWQSHSVRMLNYRAISRRVQAETSCRQANRWDRQPLYFRFVCITWWFCVFQWPMGNRLDDVILARCKMFKQTVYWRLSLKKLILEQNFIIRLPIQRTHVNYIKNCPFISV